VIDAVRDLGDTYWVLTSVKILAVLAVFLVFPLVVGYMEHKVTAHMQARVGAGVSFG
jgi:NADH:ubiquinone oxidoreductase subunit H